MNKQRSWSDILRSRMMQLIFFARLNFETENVFESEFIRVDPVNFLSVSKKKKKTELIDYGFERYKRKCL